ncbi:MAG TPA: hypothetical protein VG326_00220 [Tepidisphaeraceae bacterium]|nr:hypothetical protein [Tepidisphaeraceae bacterium]
MQQLNSYEKKWLESGEKKGRADARAEALAEARAESEKAIELAVRFKFGPSVAESLMPSIRSMTQLQFSRAVRALETAASPDDLPRESGVQA